MECYLTQILVMTRIRANLRETTKKSAILTISIIHSIHKILADEINLNCASSYSQLLCGIFQSHEINSVVPNTVNNIFQASEVNIRNPTNFSNRLHCRSFLNFDAFYVGLEQHESRQSHRNRTHS